MIDTPISKKRDSWFDHNCAKTPKRPGVLHYVHKRKFGRVPPYKAELWFCFFIISISASLRSVY